MNPDSPKFAIFDRYKNILARWKETTDRQAEINQLQTVISQEYADCQAAARLFGFDLNIEYGLYLADKTKEVTDAGYGQYAATPLALATAIPAAKPRTVREHILDELEIAFPAPMKARGLRAKLEQIGLSVHSKTVGMSLFRLSNEGLVRREGKADWYFVPESQRTSAPERIVGALNR